MFKKKQNQKKDAGFTLIELLVVIAIMSIITMVTLADYAGMNKRIEVENTAFDIALSIRETQIYGTNKKLLGTEVNTFSDGDENMFGIFISKEAGKNDKIIVFKDLDDNKTFANDCTSGITPKECQIISELPNEIHITKFYEGNSEFSENTLILFKRPNPDALIIKDGNLANKHSKICIEIKSKNEEYESGIKIGSAGDISVVNGC